MGAPGVLGPRIMPVGAGPAQGGGHEVHQGSVDTCAPSALGWAYLGGPILGNFEGLESTPNRPLGGEPEGGAAGLGTAPHGYPG